MGDIAGALEKYATEFMAGSEYFLIAIEQAGKNSTKYSVIIDGDKGVSIDFCSQLSRHISKNIDDDMGDNVGPFTYEVASPGVDRPLVAARQYPKHIGRSIKFKTEAGAEISGALKAVDGEQITVDVEIKEKGGKKTRIETNSFSIPEIKEPKIVVSFK